MVSIPARQPLSEGQIATFEGSFGGEVLRPEDDGYDEARTVWNAMIDKRPRFVARCSGVADVIAAVNFARENDLLTSVRGGGHNVAGTSIAEGGFVIDLSRLKGIRVDPEEQTARVQPGVRWGELDRETQAFGLAVPGGIVSTTGVAGLTLGGGFGWLCRKHGLTLDNLRSADVVTADGELVTASEDDHADLFWGLRGGGGNFGTVTSFEFDLHEVGPTVFAGATFYPFDDAADGLRTFRDFAEDAPNEAYAITGLRRAPPAPFLPEAVHGEKILSVAMLYAGDHDEGERVLAPLREVADPIADTVGPKPYTQFQRMFDLPNAPGARNYWKAHYLAAFPDDAVDTLLEHADAVPSPESVINLYTMGGAVADVAPNATAYAHREAPFMFNAVARWRDPTEDDRHVAWARGAFEDMASYSTGGVYVNFLSRGEERVRAAYGENYERLVEVKTEYDPENFFRMNQNVEPKR